jgi:hypothetical protein
MKKLMLIVALMLIGCGNPTESSNYDLNLAAKEYACDMWELYWEPIPYWTYDFEGYHIRSWSGFDFVITDPESCSVVLPADSEDFYIVSTSWDGDTYMDSYSVGEWE